jgi:hypothetical protein
LDYTSELMNLFYYRHHHNGRWEARIGRVLGNKYLYLGTYGKSQFHLPCKKPNQQQVMAALKGSELSYPSVRGMCI